MKKIPFNLIIFILISCFAAYYVIDNYPELAFFKKNSEEMSTKTGSEKEPEMTENDPQLTTEEQVEIAIKKALIKKRDFSPDIAVNASEIVDGIYATGSAGSPTGGPGGGMWLAKKIDGEWELIWDGNGAIYCKDLEGYEDFPTKLISECYNETIMQTVTR